MCVCVCVFMCTSFFISYAPGGSLEIRGLGLKANAGLFIQKDRESFDVERVPTPPRPGATFCAGNQLPVFILRVLTRLSHGRLVYIKLFQERLYVELSRGRLGGWSVQ